MRPYLYITACLFFLAILGRLSWLARDEFPERTVKDEVWNIIISLVFVIWALIIIVRGW